MFKLISLKKNNWPEILGKKRQINNNDHKLNKSRINHFKTI